MTDQLWRRITSLLLGHWWDNERVQLDSQQDNRGNPDHSERKTGSQTSSTRQLAGRLLDESTGKPSQNERGDQCDEKPSLIQLVLPDVIANERQDRPVPQVQGIGNTANPHHRTGGQQPIDWAAPRRDHHRRPGAGQDRPITRELRFINQGKTDRKQGSAKQAEHH
ncbi:hypothetical protein D3C76_897440 [compost metagenome]